jgi:uncharacterized protein YihD (DUF1040 family)
MRDPKRIHRVLELLQTYWESHPDLRLGQLILNITPSRFNTPYYMEDDVLEMSLREKLAEDEFDRPVPKKKRS